MTVRQDAAVCGIAAATEWEQALDAALTEAGEAIQGMDLLLVFASYPFAPYFEAILARIREVTACRTVAGCSGQGVIGGDQEIEGRPAITIMGMNLPGGRARAVHLPAQTVNQIEEPADWYAATGHQPDHVNGWLVLGDPFTTDIDRLIAGLTRAYPGVPVVGGMASGNPRRRGTHVFLGLRVHTEGVVLIGIGGAYTIRPVVAQGATPIGEPWTVTGADRQWVTSLGGRTPVEVLDETFQALDPATQQRVRTNLLVGLAINEYQDEFGRGDFVIRNVMGASREHGAIAISDQPRVGQTLQFQIRDARAADEDLRAMLDQVLPNLAGAPPVAALLCACNGRGEGLFGAPNHDAAMVAEKLGAPPLAGFFCNGEIGPVGGKTFVHGFTASIALIVPTHE